MKIKVNDKNNELISFFKKNLGWHKARIKFLSSLVITMIKLQTVNFIKLSQGFESQAKLESNLRRIQRFFAEYKICYDTVYKLLFSFIPKDIPYKLCLDRTNWKFGKSNINILMLSVAYQGVSFPVMWTLLNKRGNSNSQERSNLINKYIELFGIERIDSLLADREFIGEDWFDKLIYHGIPFYIRLKRNMIIDVPGKGKKKAFWMFNNLPLNTAKFYEKIVSFRGRMMFLSGIKSLNSKNEIEFTIIATYKRDFNALNEYRIRWQIETMFKAFKSSGFNLEDTHITEIERLSKLIAIVSIAFSWAYNIGVYVNKKIKAIEIKKHGRRAKSVFKHGLGYFAHSIMNSLSSNYEICIKVLSCT
jgi:hypothetical protein